MAPWVPGRRHESWASNPNLTVYVFAVLFAVWLAFQVWAGLGGPPPPAQLNAMVTGAFGMAITAKTVERRDTVKETKDRTDDLENQVTALTDLAKEAHPSELAEHSPPLESDPADDPR